VELFSAVGGILSFVKEYLKKELENFKEHQVSYLLLWLSIAIRMMFINRDVFIDEAFSYFYSKMPFLFIISGNDTHPPLFYLILKPFSLLFGNNIIMLRLLPLFVWILFFVFTYNFVSERHGKQVAIYTMAFLSLSPTMIFYSTNLRMYMLLLLFMVLNFWAYFRFLDNPNKKTAIIYAITCLLVLYTHLFGALFLAVEAIYAFCKKVPFKWLILGYGVTYFGFLPQALVTANVYLNHPSFHFAKTSLISLISTYSYMFSLPNKTIWLFLIFLLALAIFLVFYKIKPEIRKYGFYYACLLIPIPIFLLSKLTGIYHHRFFLPMVIPLYILIAILTDKIALKSGATQEQDFILGMFVVALLFTITLSSTEIFKYNDQQIIIDAEKMNPNIPIIHPYAITYLPYKFYFENSPNRTNYLWQMPDFTFGSSVITEKDFYSVYPEEHLMVEHIFENETLIGYRLRYVNAS
jgi:uncharacterized membrane protein